MVADFWKKHRSAAAGLAVLGLFVALSAVVPGLSPHDPDAQRVEEKLRPPSGAHWFGTDAFGRDTFTRLWLGGRLSLAIGLAGVALSVGIGVPLGAAAGFCGGAVDRAIGGVVEILLSFPSILLALLIAASFHGATDWKTVVLSVGVVGIPAFARQMRAGVLELREREYVLASRAMGASAARLLARHVLPNAAGAIIVLATMRLAIAMLDASALSFLGLGVEPGTAEWGAMLFDGRKDFRHSPYPALFAGGALTLTILTVNLFGDGLRDALDPRTRAGRD
jgi:ABC-type dipeptide/oligopeptide/nickel transport system permease subunit